MEICAVVLAATDNEQMKSKQSKFVHNIAGKPLITWIYDALLACNVKEQIYVVGNHQAQIRNVVGDGVAYVLQENPLGTGHAVSQASSFLEGRTGVTFIVHGNTPLLSGERLKAMLDEFQAGGYHAMMMTALTDEPKGYDRVLKDKNGKIIRILKDEECNHLQMVQAEVVAGIYCFDTALLLSMIGRLGSYRSIEGLSLEGQNFSFVEIIEQMSLEEYKLGTFLAPFTEITKVNSRFGLEEARLQMSLRICKKHMEAGVTIMDPSSTRIDAGVQIGEDTEIAPACTIKGNTVIGSHVRLSRPCSIEDSVIGDHCTVISSSVKKSVLAEQVRVGPYSYIHGSTVGRRSKIYSFADVYKSVLGEEVEILPHAVVRRASVGNYVFFGSQSVVVDYDGTQMNTCKIGDHCFVGSHVSLLSPVEIKEHAFLACGTVVSRFVPAYSLCIGRSVQEVKLDWVRERYHQGGKATTRAAAREAQMLEQENIAGELSDAIEQALEDAQKLKRRMLERVDRLDELEKMLSQTDEGVAL